MDDRVAATPVNKSNVKAAILGGKCPQDVYKVVRRTLIGAAGVIRAGMEEEWPGEIGTRACPGCIPSEE